MSITLETSVLYDYSKIPDELFPAREAFRFRLIDLFDPDTDAAVLSQYAEFRHLVTQNFPVQSDQNVIFQATDLMATLHVGQEKRVTDSYVSHPLDVAIRLLKHFKIADRDLIVAGLLHDVVEDQALKLLRVSGARVSGIEFSDQDTQLSIAHAALWYIAAEFGERVAVILSHLTNPNFSRLADALSLSFGSTEKNYAEKLIGLATPYLSDLRSATSLLKSDNMDPRAREMVKHGLYVGHLVELLECPDAFKVKMADFSSNGLGALNAEGEYRLRLELQEQSLRRDRLMRKYAPVTSFLSEFFEHCTAERRSLFSKSVDLAFAAELRQARARYSGIGQVLA